METDHFPYLYHAYRAGINGGAKAMNIDPSSMSRGVQAMEETLGYPLFRRLPGGKLEPLPVADDFYARVVAPAVEGLARYKALGRAASGAKLRLGATEFMVREYLCGIIAQVQQQFPGARVELHLGNRDQLEEWIEEKVIDLAVITTDEPPRNWAWREFLQVPPVLVTLAGARFPGIEAVLAADPIVQRLVCPPQCEGICRRFGAFLNQRKKHWAVSTVAGSTALVPWLLSAPDMVGLSVAVRALERRGVVRHPVPFPPLLVGAMWRGQPSPLLRHIMELVASTAPQYQALAACRA